MTIKEVSEKVQYEEGMDLTFIKNESIKSSQAKIKEVDFVLQGRRISPDFDKLQQDEELPENPDKSPMPEDKVNNKRKAPIVPSLAA
jgi:type II secretory pathway component PulC